MLCTNINDVSYSLERIKFKIFIERNLEVLVNELLYLL